MNIFTFSTNQVEQLNISNITLLDNEIFVRLEDFSNYAVSNKGRLYGIKRRELMRFTSDKDGYLKYHLRDIDREYHGRINILVAKIFVPNPDNKPIVHHKDHNVVNNEADNLVWSTESENMRYSRDDGRIGAFDKNTIKDLYILMNTTLVNLEKLGKVLNVKSSTLSNIKVGVVANDITCDINLNIVIKEDVYEIINRLNINYKDIKDDRAIQKRETIKLARLYKSKGYTIQQASNECNIPTGTISKYWRNV